MKKNIFPIHLFEAFCEGNHQLPVDSPHKEPVCDALIFTLLLA